jgi:sugar/nucleoside kinase (ribokinase family)
MPLSQQPWDVVGLGENSVDYVYRLPTLPAPNAKIPISSRSVTCGGQVATTICACAALGLRTRYVGTFGSDENGRRIREALVSRGVDVSASPVRHAPNRCAVILVDERTGERIVLWERDPALALSAGDVRPEDIVHSRVLHVDAVDEEAALAAAGAARGAGVRVTSDIDHAGGRTAALLDAVDVALLAEHVPYALTGEPDVERALRALRTRHAGWLCVTLGARGAVLLAGDRLHAAPAFAVDAVDTTGAGDVFRAGFIYALLRGSTPADILRFANAAAAVSCTHAGAIDSVPTLDAVMKLAATTGG